MKKIFVQILCVFLFFPNITLAEADRYIGDSILYTLAASGSGAKPNILFIIDNSRATLNPGAGAPYDPAIVYSVGSYTSWGIYLGGQQGGFNPSHRVVTNPSSQLENLNCPANVEPPSSGHIGHSLINRGIYASRGNSAFPNLKAHQGTANCDFSAQADADPTKGKGEVYALGNYLNYLYPPSSQSSETVSTLSQRAVIHSALTNVMSAAGIGSVANFGLMVYEDAGNKGGKVIFDIADIQTTTSSFIAAIPGPAVGDGENPLSSNTARPQAETLNDAGYYFGAARNAAGGSYQKIGNNVTRVPNAIHKDCFNHVIFITNGLTNKDDDGALAANTGTPLVPYGLGSHHLDDVAGFLKNNYDITSHFVMAFHSMDPLIVSAADSGGGNYYNAYNHAELERDILDLIMRIVFEADTSFVAPVVPTNPDNYAYSGQYMYLGFFMPKNKGCWSGNLKKYGLDSLKGIVDRDGESATLSSGMFIKNTISYWGLEVEDGGVVEGGGAGALLKNKVDRVLYTNKNSHTILLNTATTESNHVSEADLNVTSSTDRDKVINFMLGKDAYHPFNHASMRDWVMGDILHSKPTVVSYGQNNAAIFVGSNGGTLHAFNDSDGEELWSFVPDEVWPYLKNMEDGGLNYFVDGSPTVYRYDSNKNGTIEPLLGDKVIIVFGLGRGGKSYYAIDITDKSTPVFLWKIDSSVVPGLGQTWSQPTLGKIKTKAGVEKIVAFVGGGYDNRHEDSRFGATMTFENNINLNVLTTDDFRNETSGGTIQPSGLTSPVGRGIFAFEIATLDNIGVPTISTTPNVVWKFFNNGITSEHPDADSAREALLYSFPTDISVIDSKGDGFVDRLYAGDSGGRIWRVSNHINDNDSEMDGMPLASPIIDDWYGQIIFSANPGNDNSVGRKIFYRPSVTDEGGFYGIFFGTGDRSHPLNSAVVDRIYAVYDRGQLTSDVITETNLVDVTENQLQSLTPEVLQPNQNCTPESNAVSCIILRLYDNSYYGWFIKLDEHEGEKVLSPPLVFNEVAYFTTYSPNFDPNSDPCIPGDLGIARLYALNYRTGEAVYNFDKTNDSADTSDNERAKGDGYVLTRSDRFMEIGVGIPSGIVISIGDDGQPKLWIGTGGGVVEPPPPTGGTLVPIYWIQW